MRPWWDNHVLGQLNAEIAASFRDSVKGIFIQWTHDPPNPKVRAWNVTELRVSNPIQPSPFLLVITSALTLMIMNLPQIDESKRHIDKSAAADFWRSLEAWIALHKPYVAY